MLSEKTYGIIGTGAVGGYYGALLTRAGHSVHFLLNSDFEHVRRHGLKVDSVNGDFILKKVNACNSPEQMPPCDTVIVALKTNRNHLLPSVLPGILKKGGCVLMFQNGLGAEEDAAAVVGPENVMGGLCFLCSNKVGPGHICHLDYGQVTLGEFSAELRHGGITPRATSLAADFEKAGIPVKLTTDLHKARWKKLVWNVPFNGLSVIFKATTDKIMANPHGRLLAHSLMSEVLAGAAACGVSIQADFIQQMLEATENMAAYKPSMLLDYERGRSLETEAIYGVPLKRARARGCVLPVTLGVYHQLKYLDEELQD